MAVRQIAPDVIRASVRRQMRRIFRLYRQNPHESADLKQARRQAIARELQVYSQVRIEKDGRHYWLAYPDGGRTGGFPAWKKAHNWFVKDGR